MQFLSLNNSNKIPNFLSLHTHTHAQMTNHSKTKPKPQMMIQETFYKTKKFFHKTFINLTSLFQETCQDLPKTSPTNPIFFGSNKINNFKNQKLNNFYKGVSWNSKHNEVVKKKESIPTPILEQTKGDEECSKSSKSISDYSELRDLKEEKNARKQGKGMSSLKAAEELAQKMKELEMMDVNEVDHFLDIQEVFHYYSQLSCPAYIEIVDKFFMDMYLEFSVRPPAAAAAAASLNSSMRKVGSTSIHSSMRSLGPLKL